MQEIEKILEEIDVHAIEFEAFGVSDDYISVGWVKEIIRKHMNDGWIPCSQRLPKFGGTYRVTVSIGGMVKISYLKWQKRLKTWNLTGRTAYWKVLAWQENPEPYKPPVESAEEKSMREREESFVGNDFLTKRFMEVK